MVVPFPAAAGELNSSRLGRCWRPPTVLILAMDEKDIIERLGPPDNIIGRSERTRSRVWLCSSCKLRSQALSQSPFRPVSGVRRHRVRIG